MVEHFLWIAIPMAVGAAFGYTAGGIVRNRLNAYIVAKRDHALLARLNFSLLFALLLSVGFVLSLWALIASIGGSFDLVLSTTLPNSWFFSFVQLTGYAMGFLGLPGAAGFVLSQVKGDWDKRREERDQCVLQRTG